MKRLFVIVCALCVLACSKNIQNADSVKTAIMDYLKSRPGIGLNLDAMDIQVSSVRFGENEADAQVAFVPKGAPGNAGMAMSYKLERDGDKWIVKSKAMSALPGGGRPTVGGAAPELPPGHVPVQPKGN